MSTSTVHVEEMTRGSSGRERRTKRKAKKPCNTVALAASLPRPSSRSAPPLTSESASPPQSHRAPTTTRCAALRRRQTSKNRTCQPREAKSVQRRATLRLPPPLVASPAAPAASRSPPPQGRGKVRPTPRTKRCSPGSLGGGRGRKTRARKRDTEHKQRAKQRADADADADQGLLTVPSGGASDEQRRQ